MNKAYLLIGGNLGNRQQNLSAAREIIGQVCGNILQTSAIYETSAWGNTDQPAFLNQALEITTSLSAEKLLQCLLNAEHTMGRIRKEKMGPRKIDMDILFFNDAIIHQPHLKIPHPQLHNRRFALMPMHEIAPALIHPLLKKTITQLLKESKDELPVNKL
jgi:2-amino-4-hydroxy-6-hydroxymethyldihydropteridine diphosphokinase